MRLRLRIALRGMAEDTEVEIVTEVKSIFYNINA
jgi:hypothetical protein